MKAQFFTLTAAAATVAISSFAAPAHAAAQSFGTNGIKFDTDTLVDFSFIESHGSYKSALNIVDVSNLASPVASLFYEAKPSDSFATNAQGQVTGGWNNEWKGTYGNAVQSSTGTNKVSFTFKAGVEYALQLVSKDMMGSNAGTLYSTSALNTATGGSQQTVFASAATISNLIGGGKPFVGKAGNYTSGNPFAPGGLALSFDDRGNNNDGDFQDFTVRAEAVPEPLTMGGIALAGAGMSLARRRQQKQSKNA